MRTTYTNQSAFDTVLNHLRQQGRAAVKKPGGCCYRLQDDSGAVLSCAVGCMIPDDLYLDGFEGMPITAIVEEVWPEDCSDEFVEIASPVARQLRGIFASVDIELLQDLQGAHDSYLALESRPQMWERQMAELATVYNLVYTPPAAVVGPADC